MSKRILLLAGMLLVSVGVVSCSSGDLPMPLAPVVNGDQAAPKVTHPAPVIAQQHAQPSKSTQKTPAKVTTATATTQKQPTKTPDKNTPKPAKTTTQASHTSINTNTHDAWQWPATGTLLPVTHTSNLGIDISTKPGAEVHAARAGVVIYVGTGITGYGHLIILKHGAEYLSAYGYNAKNFVHEGQQVKAGQVIATVKGTQAKPHVLHFEIRDRGQPVNPLNYLPKVTG